MSSRRRVLSYEERVLWTTVTKAIAPLRAAARLAPDAPSEPAVETAKPARSDGRTPPGFAARGAAKARAAAMRRRLRRLAAA